MQSSEVRNHLSKVFVPQRTTVHGPWKNPQNKFFCLSPADSSLASALCTRAFLRVLVELLSLSPWVTRLLGDPLYPCSRDTLLKVNVEWMVLPLSLKKVLYQVMCYSVLKVCPTPSKTRRLKYLQTSCLSAQDRTLTPSCIQYTTLKGRNPASVQI